MTDSQPTTTAVSLAFSITPESVTELLSFLQRGQSVAVNELQQIQPLLLPAQATAEQVAELQKQKEVYEERLSKAKQVYEKMMLKRKAFTDPIKDKLTQIMQFENALDPSKTNNEYAKAWKVVDDFEQQVLSWTKIQQQKAELEKRRNQYRADLRAAVEKRLLEMMTGQEKTLTQGMVSWESGLTLENLQQKEQALRDAKLVLKQERYDACFNTDFPQSNLLMETEVKAFIEGLKTEFTFNSYNEQYLRMAAPIKNAYLAKLPDIKVRLEKIKGDAEAEATRKKELAEQAQTQAAAIDKIADAKREEIEQKQETEHYTAEFIQQGSTQDLPTQPTKKTASFENDAMWLQPLLQVIAHVAITDPVKIRNTKGEYVPEIQKWLTAFEKCHGGKVVPGLKLDDEVKTIIRKK